MQTPDESETPEVPYVAPTWTETPFPLGGPLRRPFPIALGGRLVMLPEGAETSNVSRECSGYVTEDGTIVPADPDCSPGVFFEIRVGDSVMWVDGRTAEIVLDDVRAEEKETFDAIREQLEAPPARTSVVPAAEPQRPGPFDVVVAGKTVTLEQDFVVYQWDRFGQGRVLTWLRLGPSFIIVDEATGAVVYEDVDASVIAIFDRVRQQLQE